MSGDGSRAQAPGLAKTWRHIVTFLAAGLIAFAVDAAVLELLTRGLGLHPLLARVPSVGLAMTVSWWINRTFTFKVSKPVSLSEYLRFAAVASGSNILNYAVFSALLLLGVVSLPLMALVLSSAVAMAFSYAGMRLGVFRSNDR